MKPTEIIPLFDEFMVERNLSLEAVLIGGAALALQGVITRDTRDCDIIEPDLPAPILEAARAFAEKLSNQGEVLRADWLNNGPSSLASSSRRAGEPASRPPTRERQSLYGLQGGRTSY